MSINHQIDTQNQRASKDRIQLFLDTILQEVEMSEEAMNVLRNLRSKDLDLSVLKVDQLVTIMLECFK